MRHMTFGLVAGMLLAGPVLAAQAPGHAHPSAVSAARLGIVHFPTSCSAAVAPRFDRAVALLHSFEFGDAIQTFDEVLAADSTCAMAHWGIALSRWSNPMAAGNRAAPQLLAGRQSANAALRLSSHASEREHGYIAAVGKLYDDFEHAGQSARIAAYERAMAELVNGQPADTEAKIFHALSLVAAAKPTDKTYANQLEAGRLLEALWATQPDHPGLAHYIIHSYDYPVLAGKARAAAQRYAAIAPSAAHALHMPSHSFTRLGMWDESAKTNARSMKVALNVGSVAEALHAADYAVYAHLQAGRTSDARKILNALPGLAARFETSTVVGAAPRSAGVFALAAIPARWALERRAWREAAVLEPRASAYPYTEAMTYFARSLGASHSGDSRGAQVANDSLASIRRRLDEGGEPYWAEQVAIQQLAAQAWLDLNEKREADALSRMREAVTREETTEKSSVSPGPLAPARELLGDMLMLLHQPTDARREYLATLTREPNRRHSVIGASSAAPLRRPR